MIAQHCAVAVLACSCAMAALADSPPADVPAFLPESPFHGFVADHFPGPGTVGDPAEGNYVGILDSGDEALLLRIHLIRSARRSIDIQTYIWTNDECARIVLYELLQAAQRGVAVRILVDHIGAHRDPEQLAFVSSLHPNIEIKLYRPIGGMGSPRLPHILVDLLVPSGSNQRMHLKTFIVDGMLGITGGRNIGNNYFNYSLGYNFKDRDAYVIGPATSGMSASFEAYWRAPQSFSTHDLRDVAKHIERGVDRAIPSRDRIYFDDRFRDFDTKASDSSVIQQTFMDTLAPADRVTYIADAPGRKNRRLYCNRWNNGVVTNAMMDLFFDANSSVLIQSPYVIVNRRLANFFQDLDDENPDLRIRISTNSYGAADHLITYATNYRLRPRVVLNHGMEVFEYKPYPQDLFESLPNAADLAARAKAEGIDRQPYLSIHAKTFVFDSDTVFVGTFNLDPRSFYLNSEGGLIIEDDGVATAVRESILRDMSPDNSWTIARNELPLFPINRTFERLAARAPIDFWPIRTTSGFELRPGFEPISSEDPDFYEHYRDLGNFPGGEGPSRAKFIVRFLKVFGKPTTPFL
ncbi:MAG: phospholipase D family protein [Candidatus Hydrogenedentes bacterium]|nr:phospholipase D family protein [Candidatus Hydrogenedentota bacterium]